MSSCYVNLNEDFSSSLMVSLVSSEMLTYLNIGSSIKRMAVQANYAVVFITVLTGGEAVEA